MQVQANLNLSSQTFHQGMERMVECLVPPVLRSEFSQFIDLDTVLYGQINSAMAECRQAIQSVFGEQVPLFAKQVIEELRSHHLVVADWLGKRQLGRQLEILDELGEVNKKFLNFSAAEGLDGEMVDNVNSEKWLTRNKDCLQAKILLQRFITVNKMLILFCLKFLQEKPTLMNDRQVNLWKTCGLERAQQLSTLNEVQLALARRRYMATIADEILQRSPSRQTNHAQQMKLHEEGWKLSNLYDYKVIPNCVVNSMLIMTGIAQAIGWDNVLLSHLVRDMKNHNDKHLDTLIVDSKNFLAWELFDTYNIGSRPATFWALDNPRLAQMGTNNVPEEVVNCLTDKDADAEKEASSILSITTGLPREAYISDPVTSLAVVNLHHASLPKTGNPMTEAQSLLSATAQAISTQLFDYWQKDCRQQEEV